MSARRKRNDFDVTSYPSTYSSLRRVASLLGGHLMVPPDSPLLTPGDGRAPLHTPRSHGANGNRHPGFTAPQTPSMAPLRLSLRSATRVIWSKSPQHRLTGRRHPTAQTSLSTEQLQRIELNATEREKLNATEREKTKLYIVGVCDIIHISTEKYKNN